MTGWCNRRALKTILVIATAGLLQGCVYDPYTGTYLPCCAAYPAYGGYAYPAYGGYQGQAPRSPVYQGAAPTAPGYPGGGYPGGGYPSPPP